MFRVLISDIHNCVWRFAAIEEMKVHNAYFLEIFDVINAQYQSLLAIGTTIACSVRSWYVCYKITIWLIDLSCICIFYILVQSLSISSPFPSMLHSQWCFWHNLNWVHWMKLVCMHQNLCLTSMEALSWCLSLCCCTVPLDWFADVQPGDLPLHSLYLCYGELWVMWCLSRCSW